MKKSTAFTGTSHDGFVRIALPWEPQGEEPKVPAGTLLSSDDSALGTFTRCPARSIVLYRVNAPVNKPGYLGSLIDSQSLTYVASILDCASGRRQAPYKCNHPSQADLSCEIGERQR